MTDVSAVIDLGDQVLFEEGRLNSLAQPPAPLDQLSRRQTFDENILPSIPCAGSPSPTANTPHTCSEELQDTEPPPSQRPPSKRRKRHRQHRRREIPLPTPPPPPPLPVGASFGQVKRASIVSNGNSPEPEPPDINTLSLSSPSRLRKRLSLPIEELRLMDPELTNAPRLDAPQEATDNGYYGDNTNATPSAPTHTPKRRKKVSKQGKVSEPEGSSEEEDGNSRVRRRKENGRYSGTPLRGKTTGGFTEKGGPSPLELPLGEGGGEVETLTSLTPFIATIPQGVIGSDSSPQTVPSAMCSPMIEVACPEEGGGGGARKWIPF